MAKAWGSWVQSLRHPWGSWVQSLRHPPPGMLILRSSRSSAYRLHLIWSILKEISPEYSLEGLMLELKLQYFGQLMQRVNSLEKTLLLGRLKARGEGDNGG